MRLIAERGKGSGVFLIVTDEKTRKGFIYNMQEDKTSLTMVVDAFIKFGYWEDASLADQTDEVKKRLTTKFQDMR
jgi:hypothetical protein